MLEKHAAKRPREEILSGELNEAEQFYGAQMIGEYDGATQVEQLRELMDCVFYMHGKFYYINEDLEEIAIPYKEILTMVKESGYEGYIACEYEGPPLRHPDQRSGAAATATWPCATACWASKTGRI